MRKSILMLLAAITAATSCTKSFDELLQMSTAPSSTTNIRIISEVPQTKAIHGTGTQDGTSFSWEAGKDDINLSWFRDESGYLSNYGPARFVNKTNGMTACFEAAEELYEPIAVGDTLYGIYPFDASAEYSWYDSEKGENVICFRTSFGSTMQVGDNTTSHMDKLDIMISKPVVVTDAMEQLDGSFDIPMEFAHLFSKLRINVVNNTGAPFDVRSIVYHSTRTQDLMSGLIYMNMKTREILSEAKEWGDCPPSSNAILQTSGITIPAGGSATLWMWVMPLDFTSANADGRKANIYLNTSTGTYHVDNVNFDQPFEAGKTYRHKFTATDAKKLEGYTLVPDASFVEALLESSYDMEEGKVMLNFYDYSFNQVDFSDFEPWNISEETDAKCAGGFFLKNSEVSGIEELEIQHNNAVSLEGLQAFVGIRNLKLYLSDDMSSVLSVRAIDMSTLTNLESFYLQNSQINFLDISKNTKLQKFQIDRSCRLASISGLSGHPALDSLVLMEVGQDAGGFSADLSGCAKLKWVNIGCDVKTLDISNLDLNRLTLGASDYGGVSMTGLKVKELDLTNAPALPSIPQGVKSLSISNPASGTNSVAAQLGSFTSLDSLILSAWHHFDCNVEFGSANSSLKVVEISGSEDDDATDHGTITGLAYLTGVDSLVINIYRDASCTAVPVSMNLSGATQCRVIDLNIGDYVDVENFNLPVSSVLKDASVKFGNTAYPLFSVDELPALESLEIEFKCENSGEHSIILGNLPVLNKLVYHSVDACAIPVFDESSYPELKSVRILGKYIPYFPIYSDQSINNNYSQPSWLNHTHDAFPKLSSLYFAEWSSDNCKSGINVVDLRPYTNLTAFSCNWKYYDSSMTLKERDQESVWITKSQETYTNVTSPSAYSVYWYYNYFTYGSINLTQARTSKGSYSYGGYAKVMDDVVFD